MSTANKDKRTKEQLLQILSNALTQEEQLGEKIKLLEAQLLACQQQNEDTRAEISQYGLPSTKESFRIDYYKTTENGRLKGIIEHLPSRQKRSFKGLGIKLIGVFMEGFLPEYAQPAQTADTPEMQRPPSEDVPEKRAALEKEQVQSETATLPVPQTASPAPEPAATPDSMESSLTQWLRGQLKNEVTIPENPGAKVSILPQLQPNAEERLTPQATIGVPEERAMPEHLAGKSRLVERLRREFQAGIVPGRTSTN